MDSVEQHTRAQVDEHMRLRAIEAEYRITLRVLAIVTERLLKATDAERIEIADAAMMDTPDLVAWRDDPARNVVITVAR